MSTASFLSAITFWHWMILGVLLLVLELFAPGAVFLWLGIAAGINGLVLLALPRLGWENQVLVFALLSVLSVAGGRLWTKHRPIATDQPTLNRRGEQYVGRQFTLAQPIINGKGRIRVDDTTWTISGPDLPTGTQVRVVGVDGVILVVAPI